MGQLVYIKLKSEIDPEIINQILTTMDIQNEFITEGGTIEWLDDINKNPKSPQAHLKPQDRELTLEELKAILPRQTETGLMSFDVAFGRTEEVDAQKYLEFIRFYRDSIEYLRGADSMLEKYEVSAEHIKLIASLDKPEPEPVKLPKDQQTKKDLQGGLFLCKSWGLQPFWVIFGNVESPRFMKERIYEDDLYNNLYKDKKGYAYLLMPLMPFNGKQVEFVSKVYNEAWEMGLREDFNFIIPIIYGLDLVNYPSVAEAYKNFYSEEELIERFKNVYQYTTSTFQYNTPGGFVWSDVRKRFKPCGNQTTTMESRCSVMTSLVWAIGKKKAAELMTMYTGIKYSPFEFDIEKLKTL